jgi:hypothetical protein
MNRPYLAATTIFAAGRSIRFIPPCPTEPVRETGMEHLMNRLERKKSRWVDGGRKNENNQEKILKELKGLSDDCREHGIFYTPHTLYFQLNNTNLLIKKWQNKSHRKIEFNISCMSILFKER